MVVLVISAYLAGVGVLTLAKTTHSTAAWWPAAGLGVLAVLFAPRHWWPAVLGSLGVAFTLANLTVGRPITASTLLGVADLAEIVVVVLLIERFLGSRMSAVHDVWRLFGIAAVGGGVAATGIALAYWLFLNGEFWRTFSLTLPSHAASVMLLTPLALLARGHRPATRTHRVELVAQMAVLATATLITIAAGQLTLGFAPLPVIVWAAVRFEERVVVVEQIVYATVVTGFTQLGRGPFTPLANVDPSHGTQHAQLYLICLVLIGLPLAKAMHQRSDALSKVLASERTFRRQFTESRVPIVLLRHQHDELLITESNEAATDLLGKPSQELAGRRVTDVLTAPDLQDEVRRILQRQAMGWVGAVGVAGQPRTRLDANLSLTEDVEDSATFSLHLVDVTGPHEVQERLQAERDYTRAVIETTASAIMLTTLDGTVIATNPATHALTGFSEDELVGQPMWQCLVAEHQRARAQMLYARGHFPRTGEAQLRTKAGEQRAVIFSSAIHRANADAPVTVVISANDVTDARHNAGMVNHLLRSARTIAFVGTDQTGRITLFNTGAEHMLGVDADSATGRELVEFISKEDLERYHAVSPGQTSFEAIVEQAAGDLSPETRDWTWLPVDRPPLKVSMTTNPVTDTFGDVFGYLFVASDVTDTRRSQEILVKALRRERQVVARLKQLDQVKDDFVSTVSHELRTPMSSIIGNAEMLADGMLGDLAPDQHRLVEVIARNGDRLLSLADDLLLLATFDHEDAEPGIGAVVDLRLVVEESASSVATMLAARRLDMDFALPSCPVLVNGDPSHLERAVTNLLTNGVKFTPDGGHVHVEVTSDPAARLAQLVVTDTGLGIPATDLDQVFGRFYRSADVQERAIQGSGLGLSIVKTIVESHDGMVEVRSEPGQGATFTITLPLARPGSYRA